MIADIAPIVVKKVLMPCPEARESITIIPTLHTNIIINECNYQWVYL